MIKIIKKILNNLKNNSKELVFYSDRPYIDQMGFIVENSKLNRSWVKKAKSDFDKKLLINSQERIMSPHKCPGIHHITNIGYIIKCEREFAIETDHSDEYLRIHSAEGGIIDTKNIDNFHKQQLEKEGSHFNFLKGDFLGNYVKPKNAIKDVIKLKTSFNVHPTRDVIFLILPVPYSDDDRFISVSGILDPLLSSQINVMLWWLCKNSYEVVRVGTPLAQIIPIPRESMFESWKVVDNVPDHIFKQQYALRDMNYSLKCPFYSEYRKFADKIYDLK
jgi:hypothetical protein